VLAIYAGFDADHAYYAYAYLREDFYKSSGARAAHAGNLTVTLGKKVKGKGKLDAEKYGALGGIRARLPLSRAHLMRSSRPGA